MRTTRWVLGILASGLMACGPAQVRPDETTVAGHEAEAAKERKEAQAEVHKYDPGAERVVAVGSGGPAGADGAAGILITVNPTTAHLADAEAHARHAKQHEAAARALEGFEDAACRSIPPAERVSCPSVQSDALATLPAGVRLHTGPKRLPTVLAYMRCHLAFAAAHGYTADALCPFAIPGVVANPAADQSGVELTSTDPRAVKALHDLVLAPFQGL